MHIFALPGTGRVAIWGEVCPLPKEGLVTFLGALMRGSCLGMETDGASFSIDPTSDTVCLQWIQPLEGLTYEAFATRVESFVNMLERWQAFADEFDLASSEVGAVEEALGGSDAADRGSFMHV